MFYFIILALICLTSVALGQDAPLEMVEKTQPEVTNVWIAKIAAYVIGVQFMLYGIAEGLTRIAVKTDNTWDNKAAAILSQLVWILGTFLGKFGYSVPKEVLKAEAKKLEEKADKKK